MATVGVCKPYYAIYGNNGATVSYSEGGVVGKAVTVSVDIETSDSNDLYADNAICESEKTFTGGTLGLTTDDLEQSVSKAMLGLKEEAITGITAITDTSVKELIYDDDQATPYLGVGFIIKKIKGGVSKWRAIVLTKVKFAVPSDAANTQGETIEWQTPEISGTIMRDDSEKHAWKKEATFTSEAQAEAYIKARLGITAGA